MVALLQSSSAISHSKYPEQPRRTIYLRNRGTRVEAHTFVGRLISCWLNPEMSLFMRRVSHKEKQTHTNWDCLSWASIERGYLDIGRLDKLCLGNRWTGRKYKCQHRSGKPRGHRTWRKLCVVWITIQVKGQGQTYFKKRMIRSRETKVARDFGRCKLVKSRPVSDFRSTPWWSEKMERKKKWGNVEEPRCK